MLFKTYVDLYLGQIKLQRLNYNLFNLLLGPHNLGNSTVWQLLSPMVAEFEKLECIQIKNKKGKNTNNTFQVTRLCLSGTCDFSLCMYVSRSSSAPLLLSENCFKKSALASFSSNSCNSFVTSLYFVIWKNGFLSLLMFIP